MLSLSSLPWKWIILGLIAAAAVSLALRKGLREARNLSLSRGELQVPGWPEELRGWQILHLSDLHFRRGSDLSRRLLPLAQQAKPDCVLITGDFLSPGGRGQPEAREFLGEIARRWPTFVVPGNEDHLRGRFQPLEEWPATGAAMLVNRAVSVSERGGRFWIAGVDDSHTERDNLAAALKEVPQGEPVLLLAHSPAIIKRRGAERASVIFSGHTHGGQICLPGGRPLYIHTPLPLRYGSGLHRLGNGRTLLIVSRGVGQTRLPLRLWCPPEMTLWRVEGIAGAKEEASRDGE